MTFPSTGQGQGKGGVMFRGRDEGQGTKGIYSIQDRGQGTEVQGVSSY